MIKVVTRKYRRTHGRPPSHAAGPGRSLWAFAIDHAETVTVRYGTYQEALVWAKTQAHYRVEVLP